jgi:hypothetical protein
LRVGISAEGILGTRNTVTECLHATVIYGEVNVKRASYKDKMLRTARGCQDAITIGVGIRKNGLIGY